MKHDDLYHRRAPDDQGQSSRSRGHVVRLTGVGPLLENEKSQKHQNRYQGCPPMCNEAHQFQGQKVKGQGHHAD